MSCQQGKPISIVPNGRKIQVIPVKMIQQRCHKKMCRFAEDFLDDGYEFFILVFGMNSQTH